MSLNTDKLNRAPMTPFAPPTSSAKDDARDLADTWRRHASQLSPGNMRLTLESCAMDLDRLAESWNTPNVGAQRPEATI